MTEGPRQIYLIVPPELEDELLEPLRRHFADDEDVDVVVERRENDRRTGLDDRILREFSKPASERRAQTVPRGVPPLPKALRRHASALRVVQRLAVIRPGLEDVDILEIVRMARDGDRDAPSELYWRTYERVSRRLAVHLRDPKGAEDAVKGTYGEIYDRLGEFDPDAITLTSWLDRVVDEHAKRLLTEQ